LLELVYFASFLDGAAGLPVALGEAAGFKALGLPVIIGGAMTMLEGAMIMLEGAMIMLEGAIIMLLGAKLLAAIGIAALGFFPPFFFFGVGMGICSGLSWAQKEGCLPSLMHLSVPLQSSFDLQPSDRRFTQVCPTLPSPQVLQP